jgi:peptidoglycan/xylan/chitin deacetylase (PgdA/CDA1 family)
VVLRLSVLLVLLAPLLLAAQSAPLDGSDSANIAAQSPSNEDVVLPWTRSIVCPVLYTHEVVSRMVMSRFLAGLLGAGYRPTTLASVDAAMSGAADTPPGCVLLTFDDALLSQYQNAVPVLSDLGVPAVFFVLPGFADGVHRYMGMRELQLLAQAGFEVEAHTCNHPNLPRLARLNSNAFFAELSDCTRLLEGIIGAPVNYVAYPSGAYDAAVLDAVARFGYRGAFTTRQSALLNAATPFTLPRIRYDPSEAPSAVLGRIHTAGG